MATTDPIAPEPRRFSISLPHWGQFLLATVVLVIAWIGLSMWLPWHREQQMIQKIKRRGGGVETEMSGPEWLRCIVGDDRMKKCKVFERVISLNLTDTELTRVEIAQLSGLTNHRGLSFAGTRITDDGLAQLSKLTNLEILNLHLTAVTDAGLAHLSGLTNLAGLILSGTGVTDAGLAELSGLTNLRHLSLRATFVTDKGINELTIALPKCDIRR